MQRTLVTVLLVLILGAGESPEARPQAHAQPDALAPLQFLIGNWQAIDTPAGESGSFTFKPSVLGRIIVRTNEANYAATAERPASRHEDLLVIYEENGSLKADYFDSEAHVIRYVVQAPGPGSVTFISDPNPREARYRLTYAARPDGVLLGTFEIAPPGSPDGFKSYLSWKARRVS